MKFKLVSLVLFSMAFSGCGVKNKPLPPLEPPTIGKGGANFSDVFNEKDKKKKGKK